MFKLFAFSAFLAVASAGLINAPVAYTGIPAAASLASSVAYTGLPAASLASPLAYSGLHGGALAYSGLHGGALAYSGLAHTAYAAAIPAPVTYTTGYKVINTVEPVEQHGYKIAY